MSCPSHDDNITVRATILFHEEYWAPSDGSIMHYFEQSKLFFFIFLSVQFEDAQYVALLNGNDASEIFKR